LWESFGNIATAAFQRRQQAFSEHNAEARSNQAKPCALQELEKIAALAGAQLLEGGAGADSRYLTCRIRDDWLIAEEG